MAAGAIAWDDGTDWDPSGRSLSLLHVRERLATTLPLLAKTCAHMYIATLYGLDCHQDVSTGTSHEEAQDNLPLRIFSLSPLPSNNNVNHVKRCSPWSRGKSEPGNMLRRNQHNPPMLKRGHTPCIAVPPARALGS